jgi:hypothetical protein
MGCASSLFFKCGDLFLTACDRLRLKFFEDVLPSPCR